MTWGGATWRALLWAAGAVLVAGPAFLVTLEVPGGGLPVLFGVPVLAAAIAGLVHRDGKVSVMTVLVGVLLAAAFFIAFGLIALSGLPPN